VEDVTPEMRRVRFSGEVLPYFTHTPGADLTIYLPAADGAEPSRRHYTVRAVDHERGLLDIDFVMHGSGPAVRWAAAAKTGDKVEVSGPIVRQDLDLSADWQLFAGDEAAIPAIFGYLESLPAATNALAYIEVKGPEERQQLRSEAKVALVWLFRGDVPGNESKLIQHAVMSEPLPPGNGRVFLAGETGRMRELRQALMASGVAKEQIFAMGYWRPGRFGGDETIRD
jgi:NADPH-dependent ferric siderophore reductase